MVGLRTNALDPVRRLILDLVVALSPARVLELDCGCGELGAELQSVLGRPITAIDTSHWHVEVARAGGVRAGVGHPAALPFDDASFDCVIHTRSYPAGPAEDVLHEIGRVLGPSGTLLATGAAGNVPHPPLDEELLGGFFTTVSSEQSQPGSRSTVLVASCPHGETNGSCPPR